MVLFVVISLVVSGVMNQGDENVVVVATGLSPYSQLTSRVREW